MVSGRRERYEEAFDKSETLLPAIVFKNATMAGSQPAAPSIPFPVSALTADQPLLDYLVGFREPESDYVKDIELTEDQPLSRGYVQDNRDAIRLHVRVYEPFQGITVRQLTPGYIPGLLHLPIFNHSDGNNNRLVREPITAAIQS
jgi:hypothetical protein